MPTIDDIPTASLLQQQLAQINQAIVALGQEGTTVTNITVMPVSSTSGFVMPIGLALNPPISNPNTLVELTEALQAQADDITQQLVDLGFEHALQPRNGGGEAERPPETEESSSS